MRCILFLLSIQFLLGELKVLNYFSLSVILFEYLIIKHIFSLKAPTLPPLEILPDLITDGLLIGVVAFAISISMVKIFATKHGYEISPNQELLAHVMITVMHNINFVVK